MTPMMRWEDRPADVCVHNPKNGCVPFSHWTTRMALTIRSGKAGICQAAQSIATVWSGCGLAGQHLHPGLRSAQSQAGPGLEMLTNGPPVEDCEGPEFQQAP